MPEATTQLTKTNTRKVCHYKNEHSKNIIEHLGYLGYQIDSIDNETNDCFWATNTYKYNLYVTIGEALSYFNARWGGYDLNALQNIEFMQELNESNSTSQLSTWFCSEKIGDEILTITAFASFHGYQKTSFGNFISILEQDHNLLIPEFQPYLKS